MEHAEEGVGEGGNRVQDKVALTQCTQHCNDLILEGEGGVEGGKGGWGMGGGVVGM